MVPLGITSLRTRIPQSGLVLLGELKKIRMVEGDDGHVYFDHDEIKTSPAIIEWRGNVTKKQNELLNKKEFSNG